MKMKKLQKLKLKDVTLLSDGEMKNVLGGDSSGTCAVKQWRGSLYQFIVTGISKERAQSIASGSSGSCQNGLYDGAYFYPTGSSYSARLT